MPDYDLVVIGAGPGGYIAAIRAAQLGLKTAVVEREEVGGVCLNWGCIPSKALLRNAEVVRLFRERDRWGITADNVSFSMASAIDRSRDVVKRMVQGVHYLFKKNKVDLHRGTARIAAPGRVSIEDRGQSLMTRNILIATGARPRALPGIKPDGKAILTSREALALKDPPASMAIVGGGAIGVEMAYFYAAYGSKVTIIELLPKLVPSEEEEISRHLAEALKRQGIESRTGTAVERIEHLGDNLRLTLRGGDTLTVGKVLLAVGVAPNSDGLGLEALGINIDRGYIGIDDRMATNVPGVFAIGDVTGKLLLAHVASAQGVTAVESIAGSNPRPLDYVMMPRATYCQPQVASFGLTEKAAGEQGYRVRVGSFPFSANGKAIALGHGEGFVKVVTDGRTGEVLGAHMIGHDVTDLLAELSIVHSLEGTAFDIGHTVHAHPTLSEAVGEAGLAALGRALNV